jgi:hypothetical protein
MKQDQEGNISDLAAALNEMIAARDEGGLRSTFRNAIDESPFFAYRSNI